MKNKKVLTSNQRKRTNHRHKIRMVNRRHTQFAIEQHNCEKKAENTDAEQK